MLYLEEYVQHITRNWYRCTDCGIKFQFCTKDNTVKIPGDELRRLAVHLDKKSED
jgi:hypothetical protein